MTTAIHLLQNDCSSFNRLITQGLQTLDTPNMTQKLASSLVTEQPALWHMRQRYLTTTLGPTDEQLRGVGVDCAIIVLQQQSCFMQADI